MIAIVSDTCFVSGSGFRTIHNIIMYIYRERDIYTYREREIDIDIDIDIDIAIDIAIDI